MRDLGKAKLVEPITTTLRSYNSSFILSINRLIQLKTSEYLSDHILFPITYLEDLTENERHILLSKQKMIVLTVEKADHLQLINRFVIHYTHIHVCILSASLSVLQSCSHLHCPTERIWIPSSTDHKVEELTDTLNRAGVRTIMLNPDIAKDEVQYFHKHSISVWSKGRDCSDLHTLVRVGVNAILMTVESDCSHLMTAYDRLNILAKPIFIAHRGAPQLLPENTLASFEKAVEFGADVLETDIRRTKDHQLILFHDATINRTTPSKGPVSAYTFQELKQLHPISDVESFLTHFKHTALLFLLEVKERDTVDALLKIVTTLRMENRVHIQSFDPKALIEVREKNPAIGVSLLYTPVKWSKNYLPTRTVRDTLVNTHASLNYKQSKRMKQCERDFFYEGGPSFIWTLQTKEHLYTYWSLGTYGLITDCMQEVVNIPTHLTLNQKPKRTQENVWRFPENAIACFSDASTKIVDVEWYAQLNNGFRIVEKTEPIYQSMSVFCIYRFEFFGQRRSLISEILFLKSD